MSNIIRLVLFFLLGTTANYGFAQIGALDSTSILKRQLTAAKADTNKVKLLLALSERFTQGNPIARLRLDTAMMYYYQALKLSMQLKQDLFSNRVLARIAIYKIHHGGIQEGINTFNQIISRYKKMRKEVEEAEFLVLLSEHLWNIDSDKYKRECMRNIQRATEIYASKNDRLKLTVLRAWKINYSMQKGDSEAAEKDALAMRAECIKLKYTGPHYTWVLHQLANLAFKKSDLYKQLLYELENLNALNKNPKDATVYELESCYYRLALIYYNLGNYEKSELFARRQLPLTIELNGDYTFGLYYVVISLLKQKKPLDALKILKETSSRLPPKNMEQKMSIYQLFGYAYLALNKYPQAEKYLKGSLGAYEIMDPEHKRIDYYSSSYRAMIDFYLKKGDVAQAKPYILGLEPLMPQLPPSYKSRFAGFKSKLDSSEGRFLSALKHFQIYKYLSDSLLDADKRAKLAYLEASFGTREKQSQIELLNARNKAQHSEVQKANLVRNITIIGIILLIGLLAALFYSLKRKVKINRLLSLNKAQIDAKNQSLTQLVSDKEELILQKEHLLADKDMLLKEVHHRVKNNLQIVMSLLSTKIAYLENKEAVEAIEESQQRVQSIALIHQKLYREERGLSIEIKSYLHDLVEDLNVSFNAGKREIKFKMSVENIVLDVEQAVPIGLILNEAITNAIKYAFNALGGVITITIKNSDEGEIEVVVKDNGKGLPKDFDLAKSNSLGMEMMKGLGHQLKGTLKISNENGVTLKLKFPILTISNTANFT